MGVSIDVFFKILVSMQGRKEGRKENLNPKKREPELYLRLKRVLEPMKCTKIIFSKKSDPSVDQN